ncbi:MAG TPA: ribonuclease D, partial [Pyrinomonadaceae bacterium]
MSTDYRVIKTADELRSAIERLSTQPVVGLDTETTDLDPYTSRLRLVQLATPEEVSVIDLDAFSIGHDSDLAKTPDLEPLRRLLGSPRPIKIAHNAKFDAKFIKHKLGADINGLFDTLLASQLVGAGDIEERHGLETVASRYLNQVIDKTERLSNWNFELSEAQLEYAARDAAVLLPLREKLIERLKADSLVKCAQLEFECVMTVVDIELSGFFMHKDRWLEQLGIVEKRRAELAEQLQEVLAEESSQGSLFGGPQRDDINLDS